MDNNEFKMIENNFSFPCSICANRSDDWERCESCPFYSRIKVQKWEVENFILGRAK